MAKRPKPVPQMTTAQFEARFPIGDDAACLNYLVARRWPEGVHCPRCGNTELYDASSYKPLHWQCKACDPNGYRFSALVGTIFENTKKPLRDWFRVAHFMFASKKGMSALQIQRMMGFGCYETAHSMCHKIRAALIAPGSRSLAALSRLTRRGSAARTKTATGISGTMARQVANRRARLPIIGAVERKGNVVARVLDRVTKDAAQQFVREVVSDKVSLLATDDSWPSMTASEGNTRSQTVEHQAKQYVIGAVHTNTIEGFWSIFKRGVVGTFHKMSAKYMPLYVAEFQFRYNNRMNPDMFETAIAGC